MLPPVSRLVFTVARGKPRYAEMAMGLGRSLALIGDPTPRAVLTDVPGYDWKRYFDHVIEPPGPRSALDKLLALELSDAEHVVSIDGDCLAFRRLDPIFAATADLPLGVQGVRTSKGNWHGAPLEEVLPRLGFPAVTKFNGGLVTYTRDDEFTSILAEARAVEADYANAGFADFRGNASEEICVALAMARRGYERLIPNDADFMSTAPGAIGRVRMNVLRGECQFVSRMETVRRIEPILFHAASMVNFTLYWRQLESLKRLERYADRHPPGYRSRLWKLRRSVERRWLKLTGRG